MHPLVRNEVLATLGGLSALGVAWWLGLPLVAVGLVGVGGYLGIRLLLPVQKKLTTDAAPETSSEALPTQTLQDDAKVEFLVIVGKIAQELPRLKSLALTQLLHGLLNLGQQAQAQFEVREALQGMTRTYAGVYTALECYLSLQDSSVSGAGRKRVEQEFTNSLRRLEYGMTRWLRAGPRVDWLGEQARWADLRRDFDLLYTSRPLVAIEDTTPPKVRTREKKKVIR